MDFVSGFGLDLRLKLFEVKSNFLVNNLVAADIIKYNQFAMFTFSTIIVNKSVCAANLVQIWKCSG